MGNRDCPCCGYRTLESVEPGSFEICPVCWWTDDLLQFANPSLAGGINRVSLEEARENFLRLGAADERFVDAVRAPHPDEVPT